jgi:hypothetical protein
VQYNAHINILCLNPFLLNFRVIAIFFGCCAISISESELTCEGVEYFFFLLSIRSRILAENIIGQAN